VRTPFYYLTEDEARRIATRFINRLNKDLFGNAARRRNDPERLTALICQHDKDTRRHLHCLFALPLNVTLSEFTTAAYRALRNEPFVYRLHRLELADSLSQSITYNMDEEKTRAQSTILYVYPKLDTSTPEESTDEKSQSRILDEHHFRSLDR
jgi:hypothetical protein